jgi:hypothetical protein
MTKPYIALKYFNPLQFWLPLPLIRRTDMYSLDGGGVFSYLADPAANNSVFLYAYFDARSLMAPFSIQWDNYNLGIPLSIQAYDDIDKTQTLHKRITGLSLTGTLNRGLWTDRHRGWIGAGFGINSTAEETGNGAHVYNWPYRDVKTSAVLGTGYSSLLRRSWELFGKGQNLGVYAKIAFPSLMPRFEGYYRAAWEPLRIRAALYGVWDQTGVNLYGRSKTFGSASFSSLSPEEYSTKDIENLRWIAGGEVELKLFSLEIQKSLSHIYYNRVFASLAYRGAIYNSSLEDAPGTALGGDYRLTQSLILRLGSAMSTAIVPMLPIRFTPGIWGAFKLSGLSNGLDLQDFAVGFTLSTNL